MEFQKYKQYVDETVNIVLLDLVELEKIAEAANRSTTTVQTTRAPGYEYITIPEMPVISRCTIPMTMLCFAVIDMFGQWVNEHRDDDFAHSSSAFFKKLASREDLKNKITSKKFKDTFRHGVMHSFFATDGNGISYPKVEGKALFFSLDQQQSTLDVKYLLGIVRSGINNLKQTLLDEQSNLAQTSFEGYLRWQKKTN